MSQSGNDSDRALSQSLETLFGPNFMPIPDLSPPVGRAQSIPQQSDKGGTTPADERRQATEDAGNKSATIPLEVMIVTDDHEVRGLIHVSRFTREDRRISDLVNDRRRRFLAVTDAQVAVRSTPSSPRHYSFLQLHLDNILMIHPSAQSLVRQGTSTGTDELSRFDALREKLNNIGRVLP